MNFSISDLLTISIVISLCVAMNTWEFSGRKFDGQYFHYKSIEYGFPLAHQTCWDEPIEHRWNRHSTVERVPKEKYSGVSKLHSKALIINSVIWLTFGVVVFVVRRLAAIRVNSPP